MTRKRTTDLRNELEELRRRAAAAFGRSRLRTAPGSPAFGDGTPPADPAGEAAPMDLGGWEPPAGVTIGPADEANGRPYDGEAAETPEAPPRLSGPLERLVPGEEPPGGGFWRVREDAGAIWPEAGRLVSEYRETIASAGMDCGAAELGLLAATRPERVLWLDLETTGLTMTPLFLVGLMYVEGDGLVVDQLFARDYTEERAVLAFTAELITRFDVLVTFNGRRFDVPFLVDRMAFTGLPFAAPSRHVDLLPVARRAVGRRTPNHRLQTLERFLLGMKRVGDVPGREIPGV
ncbi:MAG TPA: hypothetical protein ENO23_07200, partial [Alphaproteobacteria bacterium]|nr:hypothetical protein [Alphaproteobacteria bacterium]